MRTSLGRLLVLAGALAGIFAMHGLGDHGGAHAGSQHARALSTSPMSHVPGVDHGTRIDADPDGVTPVRSAADMTPVGTWNDTDKGVIGLCLAVLAGTLLSLVRRRTPRGLVVRLARASPFLGAVMGTTSRERDPPCLTQLSILRC